jgi:hypothetical protein
MPDGLFLVVGGAAAFGGIANIILVFGNGDDGGQSRLNRFGNILPLQLFSFIADRFEGIGNLVGAQHEGYSLSLISVKDGHFL